jgi:hypothetical protein
VGVVEPGRRPTQPGAVRRGADAVGLGRRAGERPRAGAVERGADAVHYSAALAPVGTACSRTVRAPSSVGTGVGGIKSGPTMPRGRVGLGTSAVERGQAQARRLCHEARPGGVWGAWLWASACTSAVNSRRGRSRPRRGRARVWSGSARASWKPRVGAGASAVERDKERARRRCRT